MVKEKQAPVVDDEEEISLDMTKAKTFSPLPERKPYLASISKWKPGRTANGRKLDYEFTVMEPEDFRGRKVQESLSLENEFTLGRLQTVLIALGFPEDQVKSKSFKLPHAEDVEGLQATIITRTRHDETYGDRSIVNRLSPSTAYKEVPAI